MRRLLPALLLLGLCLTAVAAPAAPAQAYDAFPGTHCATDERLQGSTVCAETKNPGKDPISGPDGILLKATNIVAYIAGAFAIIMILVASMRYITSGSDLSTNSRTDTDVEDAKHTITNALIGLAVIVLAKTIINFVILRL
jgi:hypothetical protein